MSVLPLPFFLVLLSRVYLVMIPTHGRRRGGGVSWREGVSSGSLHGGLERQANIDGVGVV